MFEECTITATALPAVAAIDGAIPVVRDAVVRDAVEDAVLVRAAGGRYDRLRVDRSGQYGVRVEGGDPVFTDLSVTGGEAGLVVEGPVGTNVRVERGEMRDTNLGLVAGGNARLAVSAVRVHSRSTGVAAAETATLRLTEVAVTGGGVGIAGAGQASIEAQRTKVTGVRYAGVYASGMSSLSLRECTFNGSGGPGVLVDTTRTVLVEDCEFTDVAGVAIQGADRPGVTVHPALGTARDGGRADEAESRAITAKKADGATGHTGSAHVDELLSELDAMIGLSGVKREVRSVVQLLRIGQQRRVAGLPSPPIGRHLVFLGSPGTGKTTVARLYGQLLASLGVLAKGQLVEVARADLVGEYLGSTALKTTAVFERALGGVLFIDEAYALARKFGVNHDLGQESIDALVKLMEDHRDEVVVIAAGYRDEMASFLAANPGLSSRFTKTIEFADYSPNELLAITEMLANQHAYDLDLRTRATLVDHYVTVVGGDMFGNGRYARKLFGAMIEHHALRLADVAIPTAEQLRLLLPDDLPPDPIL